MPADKNTWYSTGSPTGSQLFQTYQPSTGLKEPVLGYRYL
jgi:hypothetical protein